MREYRYFVRDSEGALIVKNNAGIEPTAEEAIRQIAPVNGDPFVFEFSGVDVTVTRWSDPELIVREWWLARYNKITSSVGPYPVPVLTPELQCEYDAILQWLKSR